MRIGIAVINAQMPPYFPMPFGADAIAPAIPYTQYKP